MSVGRRRPARIIAAAAGAVIALLVVGLAWPLDDALLSAPGRTSLVVRARDGTALGEGLSVEGARSRPLDDGVPARVAAAFIAVEDRRFYEHHGVDLRAIARAVRDSWRAGRVVSGASTLTQQLSRRLRDRGSGMIGKVSEAWLALRLELHLSKDEILRAYLERVPLGRNAVGVEAAADAWFGTRAALLTTAQAALLAGVAHAPAREDPARAPEAARARRDDVLRRMRRAGALDEAGLRAALAEPLEPRAPAASRPLAPHLVARLRGEWGHTGRGVAVVETTLDPGLQLAVEEIVSDEVREGPQRRRGLEHAAVLVLDNASGDVLAWVGSADFFDDATLGKNDGVRARRQPGSALKPFVYGRAFEQGLTPATVLADVDVALAMAEGDVFTPQNYDRRMHGPVTARMALQSSFNVPAVRVAQSIGADGVLDVLQQAGFRSLDRAASHYGVGLVLGNGEVTLEELANAYRGLANGGVRSPTRVVARAVGADGVAVDVDDVDASPQPPAGGARFLRADIAALLTHVLSDGVARAPGFGLDNALDLPFPVAAKTGTSHAWVDNWAAGYTAERTVAVWAGAFDGTPMEGVSGVAGAGVIFHRVMVAAMAGLKPAPLVDDSAFDHAAICPVSGLRAGPACAGSFDEVFVPGTAPARPCDVHGAGVADAAVAADGPCAAGERPAALPGPLDAWAAREGRCRAFVDGPAALLSPRDGDVFQLDPGLPLQGQEVPLRVRGAVARVLVDDVEHAPKGPTAWLALARGPHRVRVSFADGTAHEARFTVE